MLIGVDVDDVTADLSGVWIPLYNQEWNDTKTIEDFTQWDVSKIVKKTCGKKAFNYFEMPELYDRIVPIEGAREGIDEIRQMGHRVVFVTSMTEGCAGRKYKWLKTWGFIERLEDYVEMRDKSLLLADCLIDDNFKNIEGFRYCGILFDKPWNRNIKSNKTYFRFDCWEKIIKFMKGEKIHDSK